MEYFEVITNATTGEQTIRPYTPEEIAKVTPTKLTNVPNEVSRFQAKAALAISGKLEAVELVVKNSGNVVLQLAWAEATVFKRDSPSILALAGAVGLTEEDLDTLFVEASNIFA